MIPELGHFALALAVALAAAQTVLPLWGAWKRDARLMATAPSLAWGQFLALAVAAACLVRSAIVNDFSVANVADNSATTKPLIYKIAGTWGDHEGSILLWVLILAGCGAAVATFGRGLPSALRARVIGVLGAASVGFVLFAETASDPFARVDPAPLQGQGMNPLLQDPGLAFHPPLLYLGYVGFAVPFAFAVAALLEGRVDASWGRWVRPWALTSWCFLTCGIALGSWWAYYDLGWGGYWFWDPVENASLLPWLTGTALIHSAIVVEKRESLKVWTVLLAIGTFSLSLSGTFLVRSGILNSVHAFANDPTRGVFILALLAIEVFGSLLLFAFRAPLLAPGGVFAPISREGALVLNNLLLCAICAVVLTGTMYPPFASLLFGIKLSVGAPFFDAMAVPMALPLFAAMAIGPMLPWKRAQLWPVLQRVWWAALIAAAIAAAMLLRARVLPALGFGFAAWVILGAAYDLAQRVRLFRVPLRASWQRATGLRLSVFGAALAHAGIGVTALGLAGMTLSTSQVVQLAPGQSAMLGGQRWVFDGLSKVPGPNYTATVATVTVRRGGAILAVLHPSKRAFAVQNTVTDEVSIHTTGVSDYYAALGEIGDGQAVLRFYHNVLAPEMWLGGLIMALGGLLSLADRRLRVGAPSRRRAAAPARATA